MNEALAEALVLEWLRSLSPDELEALCYKTLENKIALQTNNKGLTGGNQ